MPEKLPVVATIVETISTLRLLTSAIARFGWLTLVAMTAQFILADVVLANESDKSSSDLMIVGFLCAILGLLNLPVITSVHRLVLHGAHARTGLALRREEGLFLWAGLRMVPVLLMVAIAIGLVFGFLSGIISVAMKESALPAAIVLGPLQAAEAALITLFSCRYFLIFPAAAVGRTLKLGDAAALLNGNVLRLCAILVPVWVTGWLPQLIAHILADSLPLTGALLGACFGTISTMLFAVSLSLVFRRLSDVPDATSP